MRSASVYVYKNRKEWSVSFEVSLLICLTLLSFLFYFFPKTGEKIITQAISECPRINDEIVLIPLTQQEKQKPVSVIKKPKVALTPIAVKEIAQVIEKKSEAIQSVPFIDPKTLLNLTEESEDPIGVPDLSEMPSIKSVGYKIQYPSIAKAVGIRGLVVVRALIGRDGTVLKTEIGKSLGGGCDEEAIEYVKRLIFNPGLQNDKPVKVWISIPVRFSLK